MFSATRSIAPIPIETEKPAYWRAGIQEYRDLDRWTRFFPALAAAFSAYGLRQRFDQDAVDFAKRRYNRYGDKYPEFAGFDAAADLAELLVKDVGYLPDDDTAVAIERLQAFGAEAAMRERLDQMLIVLAQCRRHGYVSSDTEFDHNDLRNAVYAPAPSAPDRDILVFRDQNHKFAVGIQRDSDGAVTGIAVHKDRPTVTFERALAAAVARVNGPSLLAAFTVKNGDLSILHGPGIDADEIRGWNSFLSDIETGECCLEEEHGKIAGDDEAPIP